MGKWKEEIRKHNHDFPTFTNSTFSSSTHEPGSIWECACGDEFRLSWKKERGDYNQGMIDVPVWTRVVGQGRKGISPGGLRIEDEHYGPYGVGVSLGD